MLELAYIDAGSGSLIIQAVIAAAIAVPLFFRHHIGRFMNAIRRRDADESIAPVDDSAQGR
ncbi:MAG TPA: hypothetical protein VM408_09170 [Methylomirabilota bacterium]|nr:hypothetical protein [Methylomirabilota bacterium]